MTIQALELFRSAPRYLAARAVGDRMPGLVSGPLAAMRLVNKRDPVPPGDGWARVRPLLSGICGSDLATIAGRSSFYFSALVSMPFVPGHEVVGELVEDCEDLGAGTRVVLEPVLACAARGVEPCANCSRGMTGRCDHVTIGHVSAGLQTGYCGDTGGGWSRMFVAHRSQLHPVPDALPNEVAVLVEPLACAIHCALRGDVRRSDEVVVIGAGTIGVLTTFALKELSAPRGVTVVAKHAKQKRWAEAFGASRVVPSKEALNTVRRDSRSLKLRPERTTPFLMGGADVVIDCVGSRASLDLALRITRAGGRVVVAGIPGSGADLTPLWFRELELVGAYTGGTEVLDGKEVGTFALSLDLALRAPLADVVGATYPLSHWREAIDHALASGRLGILKVAFDLRAD